jgi:hypothetical protein
VELNSKPDQLILKCCATVNEKGRNECTFRKHLVYEHDKCTHKTKLKVCPYYFIFHLKINISMYILRMLQATDGVWYPSKNYINHQPCWQKLYIILCHNEMLLHVFFPVQKIMHRFFQYCRTLSPTKGYLLQSTKLPKELKWNCVWQSIYVNLWHILSPGP